MHTINVSDLLNDDYDIISNLCHSTNDPIFITKDNKKDLVIMSIEAYEQMNSKIELYSQLMSGISDMIKGNVQPLDEVIEELRTKMRK